MKVPRLRFKGFSAEWEVKKIGDIFQITSGTTPSRAKIEYFENGTNVWVKTTDLNNGLIIKTGENVTDLALQETSLKMLPEGTVLVAMYGGFNQIGRTGLLTKPASVNQALSAILPNQDLINPYYLLTFLNFKVDEWKSFAASSRKDPNITKKDVEGFTVNFPSLPEQTKIANFLTAVDEKIAQLTQKANLLARYKKGVMQQIFSQQLRFRDDDGLEFPDWEDKKLADVATIVGGGTPDTTVKGYWNGNIQWFTPTELKTKYISESQRTITENGLKSSSAKILPVGTLLFSSRATVGDVSIALNECTTNQGFQSLIVNNENFNQFVYYWILNNKNVFLEKASGSTFLEISKKEIEKLKIKTPSLPEQTKIANFLTALDDKINQNQTQLNALKQYKQGLLQQMFV